MGQTSAENPLKKPQRARNLKTDCTDLGQESRWKTAEGLESENGLHRPKTAEGPESENGLRRPRPRIPEEKHTWCVPFDAPGASLLMHRVRHLGRTRCVTFDAPDASLLTHQVYHIGRTRCVTFDAPGASVLTHQVWFRFAAGRFCYFPVGSPRGLVRKI